METNSTIPTTFAMAAHAVLHQDSDSIFLVPGYEETRYAITQLCAVAKLTLTIIMERLSPYIFSTPEINKILVEKVRQGVDIRILCGTDVGIPQVFRNMCARNDIKIHKALDSGHTDLFDQVYADSQFTYKRYALDAAPGLLYNRRTASCLRTCFDQRGMEAMEAIQQLKEYPLYLPTIDKDVL